MKTFSQYLTETSLSRIWQRFTGPAPAGILSAFQNDSTLADNQRRTQQLAASIRGEGFGYVFVDGVYNGGEETSIVVNGDAGDNGKLKGALRRWRSEFGQESVLYKPENTDHVWLLFSTSETDIGTFHPNRAGDFMTKLRGRPGTFVFESAYYQMTFFQAMAHKYRARA